MDTLDLSRFTKIAFPGLGIEEFTLDRVAFELFGKEIYWYGVIIMLGIIAAFVHAYLRGKREGVTFDDILDMGLYTVVFGVIGARLYYVLFSLKDHTYESFWDVIAIWDGGLAIYGGVICGCTALVVTALIKKINPLKVMDMVGPGVMLAQAIGRWGNFVNGEAFGGVVAEGHPLYFMRMGVMSQFSQSYCKEQGLSITDMYDYHPTFLYESLWNIVGFVTITLLYRKKKFNGQVALMYFAWYGFGRMFIEMLRTDSLYIGTSNVRVSVVVAAVGFVVSVGLMIAGFILTHKGKFSKWLEVKWATPVPAEGKAPVGETTEEMPEEMPEEDASAVDTPEEDSPAEPDEATPEAPTDTQE